MIDSLIDWPIDCFVGSLIHWFIGWLMHWFTVSLIHWFIGLLIHWLTDSLVHWFIDSLIHLTHWVIVDSLIHWFNSFQSLIHCFVASLIHWLLVHWFIESLIHRLTTVLHPLIDSLLHCFVASLIHWFLDSLNDGFILWCVLSCHFIWISTTSCSFVDASHKFNTSLLLHLQKKLSYGPSSSYSCFIFSKLLPRCVPGTIWYLYLSVLCFLVCGSPLEEKIQRPRTNMIDVLQHLPWLNLPC